MNDRWLAAQLVVSGALAGLCWTVQLAVYPHFARVLRAAGAEGFRDYHAAYTRSMGFVAAPLMLAELTLVGVWAWVGAGGVGASAGAGLAGFVWVFTFVVMVPSHARLQAAPTEALARRLSGLNWLRTVAWTARAALLAGAAAG
jgi:hypothetical protein